MDERNRHDHSGPSRALPVLLALLPATTQPAALLPERVFQDGFEICVQIGEQCWMRENLDIGAMIPVGTRQADNGVVEKWCYEDDPANCERYGGLYEWGEVMGHENKLGRFQRWQGICPDGWHIPDELEWKALEGEVDSFHDADDPVWDQLQERGTDAGLRLKSQTGWANDGNGTDAVGFRALPGGMIYNVVASIARGTAGIWWTSDGDLFYGGYYRAVYDNMAGTYREAFWPYGGFSLRCVRD